MWCKHPQDFYRLSTIAQNDIDPPRVVDAAYLFGHTKYFERPILNAAAELVRKNQARDLFLCQFAKGYPYNVAADDYRDYEAWRKELVALGVANNRIHPIESPRPTSPEEKFPVSHTGTEAELLVELAKKEGWPTVYVLTHPIHILRAFALTVTFALRLYPKLKIYAKAGYPTEAWNQGAVSNQRGISSEGTVTCGPVVGTRIEVIAGEWERLNKIRGNKYDVASGEEVLEYVANRDPLLCREPNCATPLSLHTH